MWVNLLRVAPLRAYSSLVRAVAAVPLPRRLRRPVWAALARRLGIETGQAELALEEYRTFGDLFVRRLESGAREVDGAEDSVVSPVDGCVVNRGEIVDGSLLQAKGIEYTLAELVGSAELAGRFEGGQYITLYLRPKDYHRIHSPVAGAVVASRRIPGRLLPVQPAFVRHAPKLFAGNERLVVEIDSGVGHLLLVPVGALGVGSISTVFGAGEGAQRYEPSIEIGKGQELAAFNLGSTVILVFQHGRVTLSADAGQEIRVGEVFARRRVARLRVAGDKPQ